MSEDPSHMYAGGATNKGFTTHANKTSANGSINSDNDSGCAQDEYAWVPPGLVPEQVRH